MAILYRLLTMTPPLAPRRRRRVKPTSETIETIIPREPIGTRTEVSSATTARYSTAARYGSSGAATGDDEIDDARLFGEDE